MDDAARRANEQMKGFFPDKIGLRVTEATPERVVAEIDVTPDLCTVPGIMHGGAIMAFADTLGAVGTSLNLPPGHGTTTIESKTNFFGPGAEGTTVRAECLALHRGKRTLAWQTRVTGADGRLVAVVTQTQMVLEPRRTPQETLASLFEGLDAAATKSLLARLEHGGADIYRRLAEGAEPAARAELLEAAAREEANAAVLERG